MNIFKVLNKLLNDFKTLGLSYSLLYFFVFDCNRHWWFYHNCQKAVLKLEMDSSGSLNLSLWEAGPAELAAKDFVECLYLNSLGKPSGSPQDSRCSRSRTSGPLPASLKQHKTVSPVFVVRLLFQLFHVCPESRCRSLAEQEHLLKLKDDVRTWPGTSHLCLQQIHPDEL